MITENTLCDIVSSGAGKEKFSSYLSLAEGDFLNQTASCAGSRCVICWLDFAVTDQADQKIVK